MTSQLTFGEIDTSRSTTTEPEENNTTTKTPSKPTAGNNTGTNTDGDSEQTTEQPLEGDNTPETDTNNTEEITFEPDLLDSPTDPSTPLADHPLLNDINTEGMEFTTDIDGQEEFPHPDEITSLLDEDHKTCVSRLPDEVKALEGNLDGLEGLKYMFVMGPEEVYEYLESLQKKTDLIFENFERSQLIINTIAGNQATNKPSLKTRDKRSICRWEVGRRLANRPFETWNEYNARTKGKKEWGLPNE